MLHVLRARMIGCSLVSAVAAGVAACSTHPLPENVSRASTFDIVKRIRCEAQEGLRSVYAVYAANPVKKKHIKTIVEASTIGFTFDFTISEDTKAQSVQLIFDRRAFQGAPTGFNLSLTADLNPDNNENTRKNQRSFRLLDKLEDLNKADCAGESRPANGFYPITGHIGIGEVVKSYVELEIMTDLIRSEGTAFSDKLKFTTELTAGATPDLEIDTAIGSLRLIKASGTVTASRKDIHSVTVALARDHDNVDLRDIEPGDARTWRLQRALVKRNSGGRNAVFLELEKRSKCEEDQTKVAQIVPKSFRTNC